MVSSRSRSTPDSSRRVQAENAELKKQLEELQASMNLLRREDFRYRQGHGTPPPLVDHNMDTRDGSLTNQAQVPGNYQASLYHSSQTGPLPPPPDRQSAGSNQSSHPSSEAGVVPR